MGRWLIAGAGGMLGTDLRDALLAEGEEVLAFSRSDLDVTDPGAVHAAVGRAKPAVIVNCAAYTRVDAAESDEAAAEAINATAVRALAAAANETASLLIQISTDFVFDGSHQSPYEPGDTTHPLSVYGRTKLGGETAARTAARHIVLRTSWLFGRNGPNFVEAIRNQIARGTNPLRVVDDQRGRPTYTPHLAKAVIRLSRAAASPGAQGIFHYADADECTWFEFARAIVGDLRAETTVVPVSSSEFPRPAVRPAYSVLSTRRYELVTGAHPDSWRDGLRDYLGLR